MTQPYLIIDFDSTFVKLESLDELARIALRSRSDSDEVMVKLQALTDQGMDGSIGFKESLELRLALFAANRTHLDQLIDLLRTNVSESFKCNREFFLQNASRIFIISGGFCEYITPVVADYGIAADHVLANRFIFNDAGGITGNDAECLLAQDGGKAKQVAELNLYGEVYMMGDGFTDYQVRATGAADEFFAFTENVSRESVVEVADHVITCLDDYLAAVAA